MTNTAGEEFTGSARASHGRQTSIKVARGFTGTLAHVRVIGREQKTNAEKSRDELVLITLQGDAHLLHAFFVALVWFPTPSHLVELRPSPTNDLLGKLSYVRGIPLNDSQRGVVLAMISELPKLMTTHGMPYTFFRVLSTIRY